MNSGQPGANLDPQALLRLRQTRIFFGHQSVGANIVCGMQQLLDGIPGLEFNIIDLGASLPAATGYFAHAQIGRNRDPRSKTDEFAKTIDSLQGNQPQIALYKYCYIDITDLNQVDAVFSYYRERHDRLAQAHPDIVFAHMTVPLTEIQTGPKAWLKKALGRTASGIDENIARGEYNKLLMDTYGHGGLVFDLAAHESMHADGRHAQFTLGERTYRCLNLEFTDDGGHLNQSGQRQVAGELIAFLASVAASNFD